jgi:very-short-patch-repair endonuclease
LKRRNISAERQWPVVKGKIQYQLDFAFFCNIGNLDVETDGDTWHLGTERVANDNRRNNDIEGLGWHVLRFNTSQIQEQCEEYCIPQIKDVLNRLGGLTEDGLVSRKFINKGGESAQQLSLFEKQSEYDADEEDEELV